MCFSELLVSRWIAFGEHSSSFAGLFKSEYSLSSSRERGNVLLVVLGSGWAYFYPDHKSESVHGTTLYSRFFRFSLTRNQNIKGWGPDPAHVWALTDLFGVHLAAVTLEDGHFGGIESEGFIPLEWRAWVVVICLIKRAGKRFPISQCNSL